MQVELKVQGISGSDKVCIIDPLAILRIPDKPIDPAKKPDTKKILEEIKKLIDQYLNAL